MSSITAYGVDGCKAGWFCIALYPSGEIKWFVITALSELVTMAGDSDHIFVDIPIGLSDGPEERLCDKEARHRLRYPRGFSVFRVPVRAALDAGNYEEAKRINREVTGLALSKQTWAIMPKIKEVDRLMRGSVKAQRTVREVHPEICFWALAGEKPMTYNKKKQKGRGERIAVLEDLRPFVSGEFSRICDALPRSKVAPDDILDAMAATITASVNPAAFQTLPEQPIRDSSGLPMEMIYVSREAFAK